MFQRKGAPGFARAPDGMPATAQPMTDAAMMVAAIRDDRERWNRKRTPEFRPPWSMRSHHGTISLAPLDRAQVRDMVAELSVRHALGYGKSRKVF